MNRVATLFVSVVLATAAVLGAISIDSAHINSPPITPDYDIFTSCPSTTYDLNTSVNWASKTINALQLDLGSTGYICLDYQFNGAVPPGFTPNIWLTETISSNRSFGAYACWVGNGSGDFLCPGFHVSYAVRTYSTRMTVKVNIVIDSSAKEGIYWIQVKHCSPTIFIVGRPPSKISRTATGDFLSCVTSINPTPPIVRIFGISGIRVVTLSVFG
jgi:hypothetical protein